MKTYGFSRSTAQKAKIHFTAALASHFSSKKGEVSEVRSPPTEGSFKKKLIYVTKTKCISKNR